MKKYYILGISLLLMIGLVPAYADTNPLTDDTQKTEQVEISETRQENDTTKSEEIVAVKSEEKSTDNKSAVNDETTKPEIKSSKPEEIEVITDNEPTVKMEAQESTKSLKAENDANDKTVRDWFSTKEAQDVVMEALQVSATDIITQEQIDSIVRIEFSEVDLTNLKLIDFAPLKNLDAITFNTTTNIPNLHDLNVFPKLDYIRISSSSVKSLSGIEKAKTLTSVTMQRIDFDGSTDFFNGIGELNLRNLTMMSMPELTNAHVTFIPKLENLNSVSLESTQFSDLSVFKDMQLLTSILARNAFIKDISIVESIPKLKSLNIENFDADVVPESKRNRVVDYSVLKSSYVPGTFSLYMDRQRAEVPLKFDYTKNEYYLDLSEFKLFKDSTLTKTSIQGVSNKEKYVFDETTKRLSVPEEKVQSWLKHPEISYPGDVFSISFDTDGPYGPGHIGRIFLFPDLSALNHTVTYKYNNGVADSELKNIANNSLLTKPADPIFPNHKFVGWYSDASFTKPWDFTSSRVTQDTTLYAKWIQNPWTVTFKHGDTLIKTISVENDMQIPFEDIIDIEIPGHSIEGYFREKEFTQEWDFFGDTVTQDTTLWVKTSKLQFDVTFVNKTGTKLYTINDVPYESIVPDGYQEVLHKVGSTYTIYTDSAMTNEWNPSTFKVLDDVTLYVDYRLNDYTLTFETNGGTAIAAKQLPYETLIGKTHETTKANHKLVGWYLDASFTTPVTAETKLTADTTIYAKWEAVDYTLTFETNGGTAIAAKQLPYETLIGMTHETTKANHKLVGWYLDVAFTTPVTAETKLTADTTIYAKWAAVDYTLTFETNGGTAIAAKQLPYETLIGITHETTKANHKLVGWYLNASFTTPVTAETKLTADTTIYAKWAAVDYTLTFETNGGTAIAAKQLPYETLIGITHETTKANHKLVGWYLDVAFTTPVTAETKLTADTTIYAKWEAVDYTLTFETNGGTAIAAKQLPYETLIGITHETTKANHKLVGWYLNASFTTPVTAETKLTADTTIYAKWAAVDYTLTFETNGGTAIAAKQLPYETLIGITHETTKANHKLVGWYLDASFTTPVTAETKLTADTTIYAKWEENESPVKPGIKDPDKNKPTLPTTGVQSTSLTLYTVVAVGMLLVLISTRKKERKLDIHDL